MAVDYVLLDKDDMVLGDAYGYRDDRTNGMDIKVYEKISEQDLYARTGIQKRIFNESPVTDIYFSLKLGYDELASEMIAYADEHMPINGESIQLILFGGQSALMEAAKKMGYHQVSEETEMQFDFEDVLDYPLPEGFHFVEPEEYDLIKVGKCCWKGFNHEENEGPWNNQYEQNIYQHQVAPHATAELAVVIADEDGEYVCYAGM